MEELGTRKPCRCIPGATMSTPRVAPRFGHGEKAGRVSSASVSVPFESDEPTATTYGSKAGSARAGWVLRWLWNPQLPPAATTTMPCFQAISAAYARGSTVYGCVLLVPYERFRTRMFMPG